jgi:hypothetical protein
LPSAAEGCLSEHRRCLRGLKSLRENLDKETAVRKARRAGPLNVSPARKGWETDAEHAGAPWARHWIHRILIGLQVWCRATGAQIIPCNHYPSPSGLGLRCVPSMFNSLEV